MALMGLQPTPIDSLSRVDFVSSPKHINVTNPNPFNSCRVKLWIWSGALLSVYNISNPANSAEPSVILEKAKVSIDDATIIIEIGEYIKSFINPTVLFNTNISTSGEGVYYQYEVEVFGSTGNSAGATQTFATRFATLGWNWNYEGQSSFTYNRGSFGFETFNVPKYYSKHITYYNKTINTSGVTNSNDMITSTEVSPASKYERCAQEQFVVVYLNKFGLWDTFTPSGKITVSTAIKRESYNRGFRNPLGFNPELSHQKIDFDINAKQTYLINTGSLTEEMGQLVEEILYSPFVYLVEFGKELAPVGTAITVDTTLYSVDTTLISADNSGQQFGGYTTFRQIPVNVIDTDFGRKTRINDKNKINYNIRFEESTNKILNIR